MNRLLTLAAATAVAVVPPAAGLLGNQSFAASVPVRSVSPVAATSAPTPAGADDHGGRRGGHGTDDRPGDDHGRSATSTRTATPTSGDDGSQHRHRGRGSDDGSGDDHG